MATFLTGLAAGLGGQDPQAMALKTRGLNQKKQADFIGVLQSNNLIDFGPDGVEIDDDFYTNPEYKHLRKQLMNSGGKALFQYYEKDGSVKQGSFEDIVEIDEDNIAIDTRQADEVTPGAKTVQQGTEPDEDVALMPKSYLKRTTKIILNALLQEAAPGYGQEFGMQKKMLERAASKRGKDFSAAGQEYQNTISPLLKEKKRLEDELANAAQNGAGGPEDTSDAVIVLNEELEKIEGQIDGFTMPAGLPARVDVGDALSENVLKNMQKIGMSDESIQAEIGRNAKAIEAAKSFTGFWAEQGAKKVKHNSKNIATSTLKLEELLSQNVKLTSNLSPGEKHISKKEHLAQMERTLESGGSLSTLDQRRYDKYKDTIKRHEDKNAMFQGIIDKTITWHQANKVAGGQEQPKGLTKAQQLRYTKTGQLPTDTTDTTDTSGPEEAVVSVDGAAAVISDQLKNGTELEEKLRLINERLLSEKNNWKNAKDLITGPGNDSDRSIVMMGMAKRLAQAAGVSADNVAPWAIAYYGALENARVTGNPEISGLDVQKNAFSEAALRNSISKERREWDLKMLELGEGYSELAGTLYEGLLDEENSSLLDPNDSTSFKSNFLAIHLKWQQMEDQKLKGTLVSTGDAGQALQRAYEQSIGLAILGRAYSKSKKSDIFDHIPGGATPYRFWTSIWGVEAGDSPNLGGIIDNIAYNKETGRVTIKYLGAETSEFLSAGELASLFGSATTEVLDYLEKKPQRTNDRFSGYTQTRRNSDYQ